MDSEAEVQLKYRHSGNSAASGGIQNPILDKPERQVKNMDKKNKKNYIFAVGRRKTAVARVRLYSQKGEVIVNDLPIEKYFSSPAEKVAYTEVFRATNTIGKFTVAIKVEGSGKSGQLGAVILGIARALSLADLKYKEILAHKGFLKRDPRAKERKKPGLTGARKQKQSPKR